MQIRNLLAKLTAPIRVGSGDLLGHNVKFAVNINKKRKTKAHENNTEMGRR